MGQKIERIGVIGVGLIGSGWAAFYAAKGLIVKLYDADRSACREGCKRAMEYLRFLRDQSVITAAVHDRAADSIEICDDLFDAIGDVDLVQESVVERYDVKKEVFKEADRHTRPETIVASSSSGLLISELQQVMRHPRRSLIAHPFNPPHLIPLVELVPGRQTDQKTVITIKEFYEFLGKVPVVLNSEIPGHIANRLQAAVWREAIDLVIKGVASVDDVDRALSAGPGLRWALMGQHMIFHLGGGEGGIEYFMDHVGASFSVLWEDMAKWTSVPSEAKEIISKGTRHALDGRPPREIARWRDEKLTQVWNMVKR